MFIPEKSSVLQRDILNLLDEEQDFISMKEITERLKYPSFHSVKDTCHILQEEITKLYLPTELELVISVRGGVRLRRENANLQKLMYHLNNQVISHHLTLRVLEERELRVEDFCKENFISKSTLFRHVKKANEMLHSYYSSDLKITFSDFIKIVGPESRLRIVFYFILKSSVTSIKDIENSERYIALSRQILEYLHISVIEMQVRHIAIWVYVCQVAIDKKHPVQKKETLLENAPAFEFVEKPDFLDSWHESDWYLFLLFLYGQEYLPMEHGVQLKESRLFKDKITHWFETFNKYFFNVTDTHKQLLTPILQRQLQYLQMTFFSEHLWNLIEAPKSQIIQENYPLFYQHFEDFWRDYSQDQGPIASFKQPCFYDCVKLAGLNYFMPTVKIFILTETTMTIDDFIKEKITVNCSRFKIKFVDNYQLADLIVTSVPFCDKLSESQEVLTIRTSLSNSDLDMIYQAVQKWTIRKNELQPITD